MIEVKDLLYPCHKNASEYLLDKLTFTLKKGSFTTLAGPIGSGKSILVKILLGLLKANGEIKIENLSLCPKNIKQIRTIVGVVFENLDEVFIAETVMDEIAFNLENQKKTKQEIKESVKEISNRMGITHLLERNPHNLSDGEKQLVALASVFVMNPKIIILDDAISMIDENSKRHIFEMLKEYNEKKQVTILNITQNLNDSLYGKDIMILQDGKIILEGSKEEVLKQESIIKGAGLELPFLADLSIRLMYYGVLDHMILDLNEMVNTIWK